MHQPAQRDLLHPGTADRNEKAGKIEPVVEMAQSTPKRGEGHGFTIIDERWVSTTVLGALIEQQLI
jgi:hypothetical protein